MATVLVHDILPERILVTRESARVLEAAMIDVIRTGGSNGASCACTIDFEGVDGVTPSFLDELVRVFEAVTASNDRDRGAELIVANPPTRLSSKFEAVARGHQMSIRAEPDGSWILSRSSPAAG